VATWNNILGGNNHWPATTLVATAQQNHATYKNKTKPTVWQEPGIMDSKRNNNAALNEIMQGLCANYYAILSPPPCQVKEQEPTIIEKGKGEITFHLHQSHKSTNRTKTHWKPRLKNRAQAKANQAALQISKETTYRLTPPQLALIN
jgi:hypothetical protein